MVTIIHRIRGRKAPKGYHCPTVTPSEGRPGSASAPTNSRSRGNGKRSRVTEGGGRVTRRARRGGARPEAQDEHVVSRRTARDQRAGSGRAVPPGSDRGHGGRFEGGGPAWSGPST